MLIEKETGTFRISWYAVHPYTPSIWEAEQNNLELKASLGYTARSYMKKPKLISQTKFDTIENM
jgi:hypothetical protein